MTQTLASGADALQEILHPFRGTLANTTELRAHINHSSRLMIRQGSLLQNTSSVTGGLSARAHRGGAFGFSSTPEFSRHAAERVLSEADRNARQFAGSNPVSLPASGTGTGVFDYRTSLERWPASRRIDFLKTLDDYCRSTFTDLTNVDLSLSGLALEKALITSDGADTYSYVPRANVMANFSIKASDGSLIELYDLTGGFGEIEDNFNDPQDLYPILHQLYDDLRAKAEGIYATSGEHTVVLDSDVAGILAHEAIGHTVEADLVLAGSIAGDYIGQSVASELITLVDGPERGFDGRASIAIHVDDEGTPCRETTIIDKGILKSFLHNKDTARRFDVEPTGNARAYAFSDEPLVRMRNTAIRPGTSKIEEMISGIDNGYYLVRSSNGQADSTSEFMFGVTKGYEIKNGQLGRAIRDVTIAGTAFDMLKTVTAVSDGTTWSCGGMCGKKQMIPVGMGGPAIACRIHVGGR